MAKASVEEIYDNRFVNGLGLEKGIEGEEVSSRKQQFNRKTKRRCGNEGKNSLL